MHHLILASTLVAQLAQIQVPPPVGFVNDFARVLRADAAARMERVIADVRTKSGGEIVVVTIADLRGRESSDWAREIGRQWRVGASGGPGDRARNAGVIILLAPRETNSGGRGAIRIEVGSGAEGFITDATAGAIQDEALPLLGAGDYSSGLELITARVAQRYAGEFGFVLDPSAAPPRAPARQVRGRTISPFVAFIILIVILNLIGGGRGRRRRRGGLGNALFWIALGQMSGGRHRGGFGGGGGGGFSSFGGFGGGGGFSGGGAGRSF